MKKHFILCIILISATPLKSMQDADKNTIKQQASEKLFNALSFGRPEEIAHYLNMEIDPHFQDMHGETLLLKAAGRKNCLAACKELLKKGAQVNAAEMFGITALIRAAAYGNDQICALLLQAGADPFAQMLMGETAIAMAGEGFYEKYRISVLDLRRGLPGKNDFQCIADEKKGYQETWKLLFECYQKRVRATFTLLACLKHGPDQSGKKLYEFRKDLLRPYLEEFSLKTMRKHVTDHGKKRLGHFELEWVERNA